MGIYHIEYLCDYKSNDGHKLYHIKCNQCGYETDMRYSDISKAKECHHLQVDGSYIDKNIKWHNNALKEIFHGMKQRCYNTNNKDYIYYGQKGIGICREWLDNSELFEEWALNNGYKNGLTIDRINEKKDYCPQNCRWISLEENSRYKSTTNTITVNDKTMTGRQWAEFLGVGTNRINRYIRIYGLEYTVSFIEKQLSYKS